MPTQTPLTDAINALTTYANTVTSASDTTLSDAVATLAAGYGGGGSGYSADDLAEGAPTGAITITVQTIARYAFIYKSGLTSVSAPNCTKINGNAFENDNSITTISFPEVTSFGGDNTFAGCSSLTSAMFPKLTGNTNSRAFYACSSLTVADLGECSTIHQQCFLNASALRTLVLRKSDGVANMVTWNGNCMGGIYNNPSASTVYVPQSLITSYQQTGNWASAYAAGVTFAKIEGSIYE